MKLFLLWSLVVATTLAEPPVENRYLPPSQGYRTTNQDNFAPPAQTYGPPDAQFSPLRQTDAVFRNRQTQTSLDSGRSQPPTQYGAPSRLQMRPSSQYGPPSPSRQTQPSAQYGVPNQNGNNFRSPSVEYSAQQQAPSREYGPPNAGRFNGQSNLGPSQMYGPPGGSERLYLPPNQRAGYSQGQGVGDVNDEPANYSFEYMVKDEESGNDFGHRESRMGDRAEGLYYVLLPDGRKQTVEYEADQNGYKPKISYEDTDLGQSGYDRNGQNIRGQYQQGGPY